MAFLTRWLEYLTWISPALQERLSILQLLYLADTASRALSTHTHTGIFKTKIFLCILAFRTQVNSILGRGKLSSWKTPFSVKIFNDYIFRCWRLDEQKLTFGNDDADKHVKCFVASLANVNKQTDDNTMMEKRDNSKTAQCFDGKLSKKTEGAVPFPSLIQCFLYLSNWPECTICFLLTVTCGFPVYMNRHWDVAFQVLDGDYLKKKTVSKNTHVCVWTRPQFKDDTLMGINQLDIWCNTLHLCTLFNSYHFCPLYCSCYCGQIEPWRM